VRYRISVDTGGTFTDVVVTDDRGTHIGKAPTVLARAFTPIKEGLAEVARQLDVSVGDLLAGADVLTYGTTRATNAIVEGKTARTAFFTTAGFPDILLLREGGKPEPFRQIAYQPPYVPRWLTFEITERIDSEGDVFIPLDEQSVLEAIEAARRRRAEAVAVCLLWSIANPVHELRIGDLLRQHLPGVPYTLSHQLNPIIREYRRASGTAIDASLKPLMQDFLRTLEVDLRAAGFTGHIFIATSFGGAWRPEQVAERPIYSVGSGPALAPVAARTYARAELDTASAGDLLVCDTGGTTFDVGIVRGGEISFAAETWIGGRWIGHITGVRAVDVKSIGAGGGSVIWIDAGGLLKVGPRSAGAEPGPVCYGRGGIEPTVTDAAICLGYIDPGFFLGGRLKLDASAARSAIDAAIAKPMGMTVEEAAAAAMVIAGENIVGAVRELTIARGIDPREVTIVAGGGASGLNIIPIMRELGCRQVLLPATAAALSACGALYSDVIAEFAKSQYAETHRFDVEAVNRALAAVEAEADEFLAALADVKPCEERKEFFVEARYRGQVWELDVPIPSRMHGEQAVSGLEETFHQTHEEVFAVREPGQYLECLLWKARATAGLSKPEVTPRADAEEARSEPHSHVKCYFRDTGMVSVPRFDGTGLPAGARIVGPALIREPTTTVVVYPDSAATVTQLGNYLLEVGMDSKRGAAHSRHEAVPA
jgi:N-methylhydantoinase A